MKLHEELISKKIILWIVGNDFKYLNLLIKNNILNDVNVVKIISEGIPFDDSSIPCANVKNIDVNNCDIIIAVGGKIHGMKKNSQLCRKINCEGEKVFADWIMCIPGFSLAKYQKLLKSKLSILSMNCFGGFISHTLGLPFNSPFINMYMLEDEFIKFLKCPNSYMEKKLVFDRTAFQPGLNINYPVYYLGDVQLYMNHYPDFDVAENKWYERKMRINWYNIIPIMYTENKEILEKFNKLPYGKKVCFVPFESDLESAFTIPSNINNGKPFWDKVNHFGMGLPFNYDPFDLLLYGIKRPVENDELLS